MTIPAAPRTIDRLAALVKGDPIPWTAFAATPADFLSQCDEHEVAALVYERVRALPETCGWPAHVVDLLGTEARRRAARELIEERELKAVVAALAANGLTVLLMKGSALAYSLYAAPWLRPRIDTDLLMRRDDVDRVRAAMAELGYRAGVFCEGDLLFGQFPLQRTGGFGIVYRFDCHWRISTQPLFADAVTFDEAVTRSRAVPALGAGARALGVVDALIVACIHPAMHHRNAESLLWLYDIHLLAAALAEHEFVQFAGIAADKRVAAVCAHQLRLARARFGTPLPDAAMTVLSAAESRGEPSAEYLEPNRAWIDELASSIGGLPRWSDRLRLLREVVFPAPAYMLKAAGLTGSHLGVALLPMLYLRRLASGGWKVLAGQK